MIFTARPIRKKSFWKKTALAAALAAPLFFFPAPAAKATVTITPTIVVIQGRERMADLNLLNTSTEVNDYALSWKFNEMEEETGFYIQRETSITEFDVSQNIIFSPRRVRLVPNEIQKIRLALRLKGEPPAPGDYRAHLQIMQDRPVPETKPLDTSDGQRKMQVGVNVNVGFSIPVVYRVGESNVRPVIGAVTTEIDPKTGGILVVVPVTRTDGPYGVLGKLVVLHDGKEVGRVENANMFPEIKSRTYKIALNADALSGGTLRVEYRSLDPSGKEILDEKSIKIGS